MFSNRIAEKLGRATKRFLFHKCTLVTFVATGETDEGGHPTYDEETEDNVPCLFLWQERSITDSRGTAVEKTPTLYLAHDKAVSRGDIIRNVLDRRSNSLLKSARINTIDTTAEGGSAILKACVLEGATL